MRLDIQMQQMQQMQQMNFMMSPNPMNFMYNMNNQQIHEKQNFKIKHFIIFHIQT